MICRLCFRVDGFSFSPFVFNFMGTLLLFFTNTPSPFGAKGKKQGILGFYFLLFTFLIQFWLNGSVIGYSIDCCAISADSAHGEMNGRPINTPVIAQSRSHTDFAINCDGGSV